VTLDLFEQFADAEPAHEPLAPGAAVLRGFAGEEAATLWRLAQVVIAKAPLRRLSTPGGLPMSVALSACGRFGWHSDRRGYRYEPIDPLTGRAWPLLPLYFSQFAKKAAAEAGFADFVPDACLINRYLSGDRMGLHQDRDEADFSQPIVSVSLGLPAVFLFGGLKRTDKTVRVLLRHGDVVVWGGSSRLCFHGVLPVKPGQHPLLGEQRINLTFRKAG